MQGLGFRDSGFGCKIYMGLEAGDYGLGIGDLGLRGKD